MQREAVGESAPAAEKAPGSSGAEHAKALYSRHCSACHGEEGDGQGLAARFLYPKPRNFRTGLFRLVSTTNGVPTPDDLVTVLERGMPGSTMPPWPNLTEAERRLLADYVLEFRRAGIRDQERALAEDGGYELSPDEIELTVARLTTPGPPVDVPNMTSGDAESIARGKLSFLKSCASCHGPEGKGDGQQAMIDTEGFRTRPRDLTKGIYKGNPDLASVYRRIYAGLPGSPMPALREATPEQVAEMVHFVLSLSTESARQQALSTRREIKASRVAEVPHDPSAKLWEKAPSFALRLTPLWWRDEFDPELVAQAVHDGRSIAVRLTWGDSTKNAVASRPEDFSDMVAMELFAGASEPFLGMGAADGIVDLWQWRAGGPASSETGAPSLMDDYPFDEPIYREVLKGSEVPDFITARAIGNPLNDSERSAAGLSAKGPGSLTFRPKASQVAQAEGSWVEGRWTVVLTRPLNVAEGEGVALAAGGRCSVAFAVWDGAFRDRAAQKLVTIWNDLILE